MFYFVTLSLLILLFSFGKKEQNFVLPIFTSILFVLVAFRAESVGTDTVNYKDYFFLIKGGYDLPIEYGWVFLNKIIIYLNGSFETLLMLVSLLTLLPIYFISKKHSLNPMFSVFLYYTLYIYFYSFNISRQTLAVSIVLIAYTYLNKEKKWFYLFLVLIASLFHSSAIITLPLFFIDRVPDKKRVYYLGLFGTAFIGLLLTGFIQKIIPELGYSSYFEKNEIGNLTGNGLYLLVLNSFFLFVLSISINRDVYFKIFYFFILISNLLVRIPFGNRLIMYFAIIQIIFLPYLIYNSKIKEKPLLYSIIILYAYVIFFRAFGGGGIMPYLNTLLR